MSGPGKPVLTKCAMAQGGQGMTKATTAHWTGLQKVVGSASEQKRGSQMTSAALPLLSRVWRRTPVAI